MNRIYKIFSTIFFMGVILCIAQVANAQRGSETYTGTILSYGSGFNIRTVTRTFTLNITSLTSDEQAQRFLGNLMEGGQDTLLKAIRKEERGKLSIGGRIGPTLNVVQESMVNGKQRIFIVFERWTEFAERRGGYRSLDYPFGVIEMFIDPKTGKGEGTYIAAAHIRWKQDKNTKKYQVEIEDFGTYPAKLMGVVRRGRLAL